MALTESQVVANELEKVQPKVATLFDRDSLFYANIEKRPAEIVSARDMRVPLEIRPGGRFGHYDPAGGDLGRGDGPTFDKAVVSTVHFKFAVEWHKKAQWATDSPRKAVLNTFRHLLAKSMAEFRRQVDSVLMTGGDGVVGLVSATSNSGGKDTVTLGTDGFGARLLRHGQYVGRYDTTLATKRAFTPIASTDEEGTDDGRIEFHDLGNKQIRFAGAHTGPVNGDKIVLAGLTGANPVSLLGVPYHHSNASTGTWLGFDRATTPEIRANRVNASGPLGLSHARLALNKIGDRVGLENGMKVTAWMHPAQVQAYEELGQAVHVINRTGGNTPNLDLYFDVMQLAGAPVRKSYSWDKTRIDFIVNEAWGRAEFHPAGFYEEEGRRLFEVRGASGGVAAATLFYIVASFNTYVNNPAACSYIDGLTVPAGY